MGKPALQEPPQYFAKHRGMRQSAQKARLVMDMIRGKGVPEALNILRFTHKRASPAIAKVINAAVANAEHLANRDGRELDTDELVVVEARVDQGVALRRWRPRSRGMANPIKRRHCHLVIRLAHADDLEAITLYRKIVSQKLRVDRIADLKGLDGRATENGKAAGTESAGVEAAKGAEESTTAAATDDTPDAPQDGQQDAKE